MDERRYLAGSGLTFPGLLHNLGLSTTNGTLVGYTPEGPRALFLRDGRIAFAQTSVDSERVGQMLLANASINRRQLDAALDRVQLAGCLVGEALVEAGVISPARLVVAVREHVEEIATSLISAELIDYEFSPGEMTPRGFQDVGPRIPDFLIEAIRRGYSTGRAMEFLGGSDRVPGLAADVDYVAQDFRMRSEEWEVLRLVDGSRSVARILEASPNPDLCVRILAAFAAIKIIACPEEQKEGGSAA